MQAILLAAGVGQRLASLDERFPKCLLTFGDRSLLLRNLDILEQCGVKRLTVVVGHLAGMIGEELTQYRGTVKIDQVVNRQYRRGSLLSLKTGLEAVSQKEPVIIMDADVLYHPDVLERLVDAEFENGFLLDERSEAAGEEMMLGARDGRVWTISRGVGNDWEILGEGVGFFKIAPENIEVLLEEVNRLVGSDDLDADYENAIDAFLKRCPAHYVTVSDLPWTEIDFDQDVEHARSVVLPAIRKRLANEGETPI